MQFLILDPAKFDGDISTRKGCCYSTVVLFKRGIAKCSNNMKHNIFRPRKRKIQGVPNVIALYFKRPCTKISRLNLYKNDTIWYFSPCYVIIETKCSFYLQNIFFADFWSYAPLKWFLPLFPFEMQVIRYQVKLKRLWKLHFLR